MKSLNFFKTSSQFFRRYISLFSKIGNIFKINILQKIHFFRTNRKFRYRDGRKFAIFSVFFAWEIFPGDFVRKSSNKTLRARYSLPKHTLSLKIKALFRRENAFTEKTNFENKRLRKHPLHLLASLGV